MNRIRSQLKIVRDRETNQSTILYAEITADAFAHSYIVGRIGGKDDSSAVEEYETKPPPKQNKKRKASGDFL
jgi:hypothetical protein